jgi:hypothetical protein
VLLGRNEKAHGITSQPACVIRYLAGSDHSSEFSLNRRPWMRPQLYGPVRRNFEMSGEISLLFIALGVIIILLDLWAIVSVYRSDKGVEAKALWSLLIALFPVLGLGLWGLFGPRGMSPPPSSPEHSK